MSMLLLAALSMISGKYSIDVEPLVIGATIGVPAAQSTPFVKRAPVGNVVSAAFANGSPVIWA